jgi:hypothetical protein
MDTATQQSHNESFKKHHKSKYSQGGTTAGRQEELFIAKMSRATGYSTKKRSRSSQK